MDEPIENNNNLIENNNINDLSSSNLIRRTRPLRYQNLYNPLWSSTLLHFNIPSNIILNTNLYPYNILNSELLDNENDTQFFRNILEESFIRDKNKYKKVLSDKGKEQLEKISFKKQDYSNTNTSCPIYQTDFVEDEIITKLPCGHCFTTEAITKWLSDHQALCPVCRYQLDNKEVEDRDLHVADRDLHVADRDLHVADRDRDREVEDLHREVGDRENNLIDISGINFSNNAIRNSLLNMLEILENRDTERQIQEAILESIIN